MVFGASEMVLEHAVSRLTGKKINSEEVNKMIAELKERFGIARVRKWHSDTIGDAALDIARLNLDIDENEKIVKTWMG